MELSIPMDITLTGTATDTDGTQSTVTVDVTVDPVVVVNPLPPVMGAPVLSPVMPATGYAAGTTVTVTFSATDPQSEALTYTANASDSRKLTPVAGTVGAFTFVA
jgi:hypothetical protein